MNTESSEYSRLRDGIFVDKKLMPVAEYSIDTFPLSEIDRKEETKRGQQLMQDNPELFIGLFVIAYRSFSILEENGQLFNVENEGYPLSYVINTGYEDMVMCSPKAYMEAVNLKSYVTEADKMVWNTIVFFEGIKRNNSNKDDDDLRAYEFALIDILLKLEEKEFENRNTIKVEALIEKEPELLLSCLTEDWTTPTINEYITEIDFEDYQELEQIGDQRKKIKEQILQDRIRAKEFVSSEESQKAWESFLDILNYYAYEESKVIDVVTSKKLKLKRKEEAIERYQQICRNAVTKEKLVIEDRTINVKKVLDNVVKRCSIAADYVVAKTEETDEEFAIPPNAVGLAYFPKTFNYLLLCLHLFRIKPRYDNAVRFLEEEYDFLCGNLEGKRSKTLQEKSIDGMVKECFTIIDTFYNEHGREIKELSYDDIQDNVSSFFDEQPYTERLFEKEEKKINDILENAFSYARTIDGNILMEDGTDYFPVEIVQDDFEELLGLIKCGFEEENNVEKEVLASRFIYSLNAIFLLYEFINIVIVNEKLDRHIKEPNELMRMRNLLYHYDALVTQLVYEKGIQAGTIDMTLYREIAGININSIAEKELKQEIDELQLKTEAAKEAFKIIDEILSSIENSSVEELINQNFDIRAQIQKIPEYDDEDRRTLQNWIEEKCIQLRRLIIEQVKDNDDDFDNQRVLLREVLGDNYTLLPKTATDALATAEILYKRYANKKNEDEGFDFSSISALYYQSVESAYNELLWKGYVEEVDNKKVRGKKVIELLKEKNNDWSINIPGFVMNYFPRGKWHCYLYNLGQTQEAVGIKGSCMYGNFIQLLRWALNTNYDSQYRRYLASTMGYDDENDLINDTVMMDKIELFVDSLDAATENRNIASHGGTIITKDQCTEDQRIVLNSIKETRDKNIGLIKQLLSLFE